jgi:predicted O-methyltransferase YrrM
MKNATIFRDILVSIVAKQLRRLAPDPRYFEVWQRHGFHILPIDSYSPIPDTSKLAGDIFSRESISAMRFLDSKKQWIFLERITEPYRSEFSRFPKREIASSTPGYFFGNPTFGPVDAELLYCIVRDFKPRRVIEIGSGFSTLAFCEALKMNLEDGYSCEFTAIEPFPLEFLNRKLSFPVSIIKRDVQVVELDTFKNLQSGDILFIDSTHVAKIGSDVLYEFLEILPALAPGVLIHVHDIFLPGEYPDEWVRNERRFWNEQYLLHAMLCGGNEYEVLWAGAFMRIKMAKMLESHFSYHSPESIHPASFWMRKKPC